MGSKTIRNIQKIFKATSGVLFGRKTAGTGRGEELTPSDVRTLLSVYTASQTDTAISTAVNSLVAGAPGLLDTLDELSAALGDDANFASTVTTALAGKVDSSSLSESIDDRVAALLVAGTNISITYNDASNTLTIANTAAGLSGTGSVDNAVLRADGTGGATLQASAWVINDNLTASPNNTVNHACLEATGGTTNVSVSIKPKGTGAFCLAAPDGTATGGNVRGANAIDLQTSRSAATQVASGSESVAAGSRNTVSGTSGGCVGIGYNNNVQGANSSWAIGKNNTCGKTNDGESTIAIGSTNVIVSYNGIGIGYNNSVPNASIGGLAIGNNNTMTSASAIIVGSNNSSTAGATVNLGNGGSATRYGQFAWSSGYFAAAGDAQDVGFIARNKTTNATPVNITLDGSTTRLTVPSGKTMSGFLIVKGIKSDGSAKARFVRLCDITNVGGTTAMDVAAETIGTDYNPSGCTLVVTGENATDDLQINITGPAGETWRWVAKVSGLEIAYGT